MAPAASAPTSDSPSRTPMSAPCGWPTAPTKCTDPWSHVASSVSTNETHRSCGGGGDVPRDRRVWRRWRLQGGVLVDLDVGVIVIVVVILLVQRGHVLRLGAHDHLLAPLQRL